MKRTWEGSDSGYAAQNGHQQQPQQPHHQQQQQQRGQADEAVWAHPYAPAYQNIPNPFTPSPLHNSTTYDPTLNPAATKKARTDSITDGKKQSPDGQGKDDGSDGEGDDDDDEEDDDDENEDSAGRKGAKAKGNTKQVKGPDGKTKTKLTRGSRACVACRKIKMRCIPDESAGANGICKSQRCKSGGHECIFEESNRGKRSTRKNEALAAKLGKMEAALKGIGAALSHIDQSSLNSFSSALHSSTSDPDIIDLIASHASSSTVPTIAVAMNRHPAPNNESYSGSFDLQNSMGMRGGDSAHGQGLISQPPLSPRLHSLPDNTLSPLGLLAEASLQNDASKKSYAKQAFAGGAGKAPGSTPGRPPSSTSGGVDRHLPSHSPTANAGTSGGMQSRSGIVSANYRMATSDVRGGGEEEDVSGQGGQYGRENGLGVSSQNYFKPGASTSLLTHPQTDDRVPELLTIATREEIGELFDIFFDNMSFQVPLVYKEFHTPDLVLQRSQFLCTVICAIAARYYHAKPELHHALSAYAKRLAFEVPSRGYKSVEVVQAYLLLSLWTLGPEKTFEQDRTWLMLGMAIRMATDLNLHRKSLMSNLDTDEGRARDLEIINRERCWLHCFVLDRSLSAQMGKPYTLREDYIIRNACEASWHQQRFSLPSDHALSGYVALQQIMSRAIDSIYSSTTTVSGLRHDCDYMLIVRSAHEELRRWLVEFAAVSESPFEYDSLAQFYFAYSSLVLYSFGLENALERAKMDISFFLTNVYEAATKVCTVVKDQFLPKGSLPYLPDTNFVMCSYALLSLLKLLKPELRPYHDSEEAIFKLVSEMADILEDCAVDPSHQPAIYAAFIREIVRKTKEMRHSGAVTAPTSPGGHHVLQNHLHGIAPGQPAPMGLVAHAAHAANAQAAAAAAAAAAAVASDPTAGAEVPSAEGGAATAEPNGVYDPSALMGHAVNWHPDVLPHETQFAFIPQGGDMMILPSQAGPSIAPSPTSAFLAGGAGAGGAGGQGAGGQGQGQSYGGTPQASNGWAEYLPTFMSSDGFDGWDGSMLLPGFGRGQITLSGGLLHSQYGSGIITPAHQTPIQSRMGSRAGSRAQTPHHS
ncbi:hypothetical protein IAT38_006967 [Cryptococcus sp. DSM 104549]